MTDTKLWTRAFEALQQLHDLEGGNAVIRVLSKFFTEADDHRFVFKKNRKAFTLFAIEDGWYDDVIGRVDSLSQSVKIGPDQALSIRKHLTDAGVGGPWANGIRFALKELGITETDLQDIIDSTKEEQ